MVRYVLLGTLLALAVAIPLAWKWELGVGRAVAVLVGLGLVSGLAVAGLGELVAVGDTLAVGLVCVLSLALALALVAYRFYRDPDRVAPDREDVIVSPADGEVIYVRQSRGGTLPISTKHGRSYELLELTRTPLTSAEAIVVGIAMNFLDVHVNRAPVAGRVTAVRHFAGSFGSLKRPEMVFENERATTVIEAGGLQVAVVQIASRLVRQIVTLVREGQEVALGQRIGVIRFGSQVDLVLPANENLTVAVEPGVRVRAGQSVVAVIEHVESRVVAS
jgi:phosphatidylserine decarboxylase